MWVYARGMFLSKVDSLLGTYEGFLRLAESAKAVASQSPTASKNAGWVHVELRNQSAPSELLLFIRENDPDTIIANIKSDIELLHFVKGSNLSSVSAVLLKWVDERHAALTKE